MKYTNKQNLPNALFEAIANDPYKKGGDFSASELPGSPQIRTLKKRYFDKLEVDVADLLYPLIGNNTHYILERAGVANSLTEEQLVTNIGGAISIGTFKVSGKPDLFDADNILWDYKVTTRYVLIDGVKPEWEAQANILAWLLETHGFAVKGIRICCIFRDWSKIQAMKNPDYPKCQVAILPVKRWDSHDTELYINERLTCHLEAEVLTDHELPPCTPEERWEKPTIYAIMKKGRKSSLRNLSSFEDAQKFIGDKQLDENIHSIQVRPGESTRCEYYCDVKDYCQQYKKMKED
jgi:hypothetical protein